MTRSTPTLRIQVRCRRAFVETNSLRAYLSAVCEAIAGEWPYRYALITKCPNDQEQPEIIAAAGFHTSGVALEDLVSPAPVGMRGGVTHRAHDTLEPVVVDPLEAEPIYADWLGDPVRRELRAGAAVPLVSEGHVAGVLTVYAAESGAFSPSDLRVFRSLAGEVACCALSLSRSEELSDVEETLYFETDFAAAILNTVDAVILRLDPQGQIQTANKRAGELAQQGTEASLRGALAAEVVARGFESEFSRLLQDALDGKATTPREIPAADELGRVRLFEWRTTVHWDERGQPEYVVAAALDVTERRHAEAALRERERYLSALDQVGTVLLGSAAEVPYDRFLEIIGQAIEAHRAFCALTWLDQRAEWRGRMVADWYAPGQPTLRLPNEDFLLDEGPLREWYAALARGETVCVSAGCCSEEDLARLQTTGAQSLIMLPVMIESRFCGFVGLDTTTYPRPWNPAEREFVRAAVQSLAQGLKRRRIVGQREALQRVARRLTAPLTAYEIGRVVAEECRGLFLHDALALGLLNAAGDTMTGIYEEDTPEGADSPVEDAPTDFPVFDPRTGERVWQGKPLLVNRPTEPAHTPFLPFCQIQRLSRSLMFVPVLWQGKAVGSLTVQSYTAGRYDDADLRLLESVADHVGGALARARAEERLQRVTRNLARAQQIASLGSWEINVQTGTWWWSDEVYRLIGYEPGEVTPSQDRFLSHIHPADRKMMKLALDDAVSGRRLHDLRCRLIRRDGAVRHLHVLGGELVLDARGNRVAVVGTSRDITEQVEAENALIHSERLLAKAQQMAHLGHWEVDYQTKQVTWSEELYRILGLDPARVKPSLQQFYDSIHPDDVPLVRTAERNARLGVEAFKLEYRIVRPDGSVRHVLSAAELAWDADGHVLRATGTTLDITERKLVEQSLRRSQQLLAQAQKMARIAYWEFDVTRGLAEVSEEFYEIGGFPSSAVTLTPEFLLSITHPDDRACVETIMSKAIAGEAPVDDEYRVVRPDGKTIYVHARAEPIRQADGSVARLVGFVQDITQRKEAEERLRQSERMLAVAQQIARLGHFDYDVMAQRSVWSDEIYRLCGLEPGSVVPTLDRIMEMIHPDDRGMVAAATEEAIAGGTTMDLEYRALRADGEVRTMHVICQPVRSNEGNVVRLVGTMQDVTERVRMLTKLAESERTLAKAQAVAHLGHWSYEVTSQVAECSDEMYRIFGFEPGSVAFTNDFFLSRVHPEDREELAERTRRVFELGENYDAEYRIVRPDGSVRYVHSVADVERNAQGVPVRALGATLDITERKRAEEALRDSERRYRAVVEAQTELVCRTKPDTTVTFVNDAYCRYYGTTREKALGRSFLSHVLDEDLPIIARTLEEALQRGGVVTTIHRALKADGEVRWQQWTTVPIVSPRGEVIEMQAVGRDITEQCRTELALIESQRRYAVATNVGRVGIWQLELASDAIRFEPVAGEMLGLSPQELDSNREAWLRLLHPDDRERFKATVRCLTYGECESAAIRVRIRHGEGATRHMQVAMGLVRDADGNPASVIGALADVTEQCRLEELLRLSSQFIQDIVEHRSGRVLYIMKRAGPDKPWKYVCMDKHIEDMAGIPLDKVTPESLGALVCEHRTLTPGIFGDRQPLIHLLRQGPAERYEAELRLVTPQGHERWIRDVSLPLFEDINEPLTGVVGMLWDITAEKGDGV